MWNRNISGYWVEYHTSGLVVDGPRKIINDNDRVVPYRDGRAGK